jgi:hypothetical protein
MDEQNAKTLVLTLDGEESRPRSRRMMLWTQVLLSLSFFVQGIIREDDFSYIFLGMGCVFLFLAVMHFRLMPALFLHVREDGLEGRVARGKKISLTWDEIASVEASTFEMVIHIKDGRHIPVDLSNLTYKQHKIVKPAFLHLMQQKGVPVKAG